MSAGLKHTDFLPMRIMPVQYKHQPCFIYTFFDEYIWGVETLVSPREILPEDKTILKQTLDKQVEIRAGSEGVPNDYPNEYYRELYAHHYVINHKLVNMNEVKDGRLILDDFLAVASFCLPMPEGEGKLNSSDDIIIMKIVYLCEKYGLLQNQKHERANSPFAAECLYFGFSVDLVIYRLQTLYGLFLAWKKLIWNDNRENESLLNILHHSSYLPVRGILVENEIEKFVTNVSRSLRYTAVIDYKPDRTMFHYRQYECVMDAVIGLMLSIFETGQDVLEGRSIAYCKSCQIPFMKFHGSKEYCEDHDKGWARSKRCRDKKKAVMEVK